MTARSEAIERAARAVVDATPEYVTGRIANLRAALAATEVRKWYPGTDAPCPDGVENCPGDCTGAPTPATGERGAYYDILEIATDAPENERNERDMKSITPYPTGHECPECGRDPHDVACPRAP